MVIVPVCIPSDNPVVVTETVIFSAPVPLVGVTCSQFSDGVAVQLSARPPVWSMVMT